MQQRRLRLGDILDDYCPRERRVTNHAVVAMIDDQVKQVRCSTCEADHEYKGARVPTLRRKKEAGILGELAAGAPRPAPVTVADEPDEDAIPDLATFSSNEPMEDAIAVADAAAADDDPPEVSDDEGPVHRRLIRATLPRPE